MTTGAIHSRLSVAVFIDSVTCSFFTFLRELISSLLGSGAELDTANVRTPDNLSRFNVFCNERIVAKLCKLFVKSAFVSRRQETKYMGTHVI